MSMTDPIADYLTRIRNAVRAEQKYVDIPASRIKREITQILWEKKYIKRYLLVDDKLQGLIRVYLKYDAAMKPVISGLRRISRPGRRVYTKVDKVPRVYNNLGIAIMTTSKGLMTNLEAKRQNIGGEILFYIW